MASPLTSELVAAGARFPSGNPEGTPTDFGNSADEYQAARGTAALVDRSHLAKIEFRGRDRAKFLHNFCTNDVKGLACGSGREAFITNAQGKILAFVRIFAGSDSIYVDTATGAAAALLKHFERYLIMEKVELADHSTEYAQMAVIGPRANAIVSRLDISLESSGGMGIHEASVDGIACLVIHHDQLGDPAFEFRVPADQAAAIWRSIHAAGGQSGLELMGEEAYEIIRVEAGLPEYGKDMDETNLPQEIGRDRRAISFTKGCYLGQETIARIDALGHVNRHLVGLHAAGTRTPFPHDASISSAGNQPIGRVTSSVRSPARGGVIALGFVRRGQERPGTDVTIELPGEPPVHAVVHALPFVESIAGT